MNTFFAFCALFLLSGLIGSILVICKGEMLGFLTFFLFLFLSAVLVYAYKKNKAFDEQWKKKEEQKKIESAVLSDKRDKMFGIILCLYTGLRIGELLALEWSDIDLTKSELYVSKTCYDGRDENGKSIRIIPKTLTEEYLDV